MNLLQSFLAFIFALGPLVVAHELGHYLVARWCGVKVLRFSVGLGNVVWSRRFGADQTEWAISAWPLGGYVKMLDVREAEEGSKAFSPDELKREFTHQSVWKRIAIVAAGPLANFLLAIALLAVLFMHGVPEPATILRDVLVQTPAHLAGLRGGDKVLTVNGEPVTGWSELRWEMLQAALRENSVVKLDIARGVAGEKAASLPSLSLELPLSGLSAKDLEGDFLARLGLEIARPPAVLGKATPGGPAQLAGFQAGDRILTVDSKPVIDSQDLVEQIRAAPDKILSIGGKSASGEAFLRSVRTEVLTVNDRKLGRIQVEISSSPTMVSVKQNFAQAMLKGAEKTWSVSVLTVKVFGKMLIGEASWKNVTGPITIADYAGQSARLGWESFVGFIALISISLGVMNLLPIPVLDGGFLLYYSLEVLMGRPLPERVGDIAQRVGLGLLIMLMSVAIVNDVVRLLP